MLSSLQRLLQNQEGMQALLAIAAAFLVAWIFHLFSGRLARRLVTFNRFTAEGRRLRPERRRTLSGLLSNAISLAAFTAAILFSVGYFVGAETLVWVVGLFSAAFGLGARPLVNDFLAGLSFIFEDTFDVGEKVEILDVEGVIEKVTLRVTHLRAPTGELYVIPNGDIRVIRNFSRGRFSSVTVRVKVPAGDLNRTLELLEGLGEEAVVVLPGLLEPWQILSESGALGENTELTLLTRARFGYAAEMRLRLLAFIQERLSEAGITLAD